jgi:hypothetical protein
MSEGRVNIGIVFISSSIIFLNKNISFLRKFLLFLLIFVFAFYLSKLNSSNELNSSNMRFEFKLEESLKSNIDILFQSEKNQNQE